MRKLIDLTGQTFERLTVLKMEGRTGRAGNKRVMWKCLCVCGTIKIISGNNLKTGHTRSCGCLYNEINITHGMSRTSEYGTWCSMIKRCTLPNNADYKNYGGRGITICQEWRKSFEAFFRDMGKRPLGLTIERIDNNLGYFKDNCCWATRTEQIRNRRPREYWNNENTRSRASRIGT